jgi:hypothetical protein
MRPVIFGTSLTQAKEERDTIEASTEPDRPTDFVALSETVFAELG